MHRRSTVLVFALLVALCAASTAEGAERPATQPEAKGEGRALFEGRWIDLDEGWGAARACLVAAGRPIECFRSTLEMRTREAALLTPDVNCSSPLRLYNLTNQGGSSVSILTRGQWVNLSGLSFDNKTSSYTVGACAAELAALSGGDGAHYSGCLDAWCQEDSMSYGWNNITSSVYLH
jgi:hypothetical protein